MRDKLFPAQVVLLERIRCAGGVAFMARDCRDVLREVEEQSKEPSDEQSQPRTG